MDDPPANWLPLHVYLNREPSLRELAAGAWRAARRQHFVDDTWRDRATRAVNAIRLRYASRWESLRPLTPWRYTYLHVVLRVIPIACVGFFLLFLVSNALGNPTIDPPLGILRNLMFLGALVGSIWGIVCWPLARGALAWAELYRQVIMHRQNLLLSPEGLVGWRLVQRDGAYVLAKIETEEEPSN